MPDLTERVEQVAGLLLERRMKLATAESCTGGLIAAAITGRPGSSKVFDRGFVTYTNESKQEMLGVPSDVLERHGAVSPETALAMVRGALGFSNAALAISVTGIAGPDGGSEQKPVGLVYIGVGFKDYDPEIFEHHFSGSRTEIRTTTVHAALDHAITLLQKKL